MMMMQNITGDFIRSMPVTVVYTLTASLLVSLILTPYLSSKYLHIDKTSVKSRARQFLDEFISRRYRPLLAFVLERPKSILALALIVFFLSLSLFPLIGVSFFPKAEKPQLLINIDTPQGSSLVYTTEITGQVEHILGKRPEIAHFATNIGRGNPRIYYNVLPKRSSSTHAQIFVILKRFELREFERLLADLRSKFVTIPGVKIEVKEFEQGPPVEAPIAIRVIGDNLSILKDIAHDVEEMIASTSGSINIFNPLSTSKTDLRFKINRAKAALFGVPLVEIDRTIRASIAGLPISTFRDKEGKEYDIVVRLPFEDRLKLRDLERIYVSSINGAQIPLQQIAELKFQATPIEINHYNLERNVTLTADVVGDKSVDKVTREIIAKLRCLYLA